MTLRDQVASTLRRLEVPRGARVLAAVSGGGDSVYLAQVLADLSARGDVTLAGLAHLNHQLRGTEGDADEAFVADLALALGVPFRATRADVRSLAALRHESLEAAGRRARYRFLADAAADLDAAFIATGHTQDDQAETVLLRLLRGAGTRGLSGVRARRGAVIRPLIDCRRADVRAALSARGVAFREDATNADVRVARNRVRHELLPAITRVAPGAIEALARAAALFADDDALLERAAMAAAETIVSARAAGIVLDRARLAAVPAALARRVIRRAIERAAPGAAPRMTARHIEAVRRLARAGAARHLDLPGMVARLDAAGIVLVEVDADARTLRRAPFEHRLSVPGDVFVPECGWRIFAQIRTSRDQMVSGGVESREALEIAVPAAQMAAPVTVRNRRPGDRIKPLGAPGRKKLQDLLVDRKVPRHERDRVPVVVDGHGRLVWVVGVAMADEFRVTEPAAEVVVFTAERQ